MKYALIALMLMIRPAYAETPVNVRGYDQFCAAHKAICQSGGDQRIFYTPSLKSTLDAVQHEVNASIHYEVTDKWAIDPKSGDCEDYAVSKLVKLMKAGYPREALRLSFVQFQEYGIWQNHMVLTVRTTAGDFVLDNRRQRVTTPDKSYVWFATETAKDGRTRFVGTKGWDDFWAETNWNELCGYDCGAK